MGHYNHTIVHHYHTYSVRHSEPYVPRHSCCSGSIFGYGGGCCGGGLSGGFWGGFWNGLGQGLGGWLGGMFGGFTMGMFGGGLYGGMMGMPFMGGGMFGGFNLYPENYDYGMMGMGMGAGYMPAYTSGNNFKPATNDVETLARSGAEAVADKTGADVPEAVKADTENADAASSANQAESTDTESESDHLNVLLGAINDDKTSFTKDELDTLVTNFGKLDEAGKNKLKPVLLKQLEGLKANDDGNEYYKISKDEIQLKALELLCRLEPNTVVRCVTRGESDDKYIQGTLSNVKKEGNKITYNITCKVLGEDGEKCGCILGAVYEMEQEGGTCKPTKVYKVIGNKTIKVDFNTETDYKFADGIWVNKANPTVSEAEIERIKKLEEESKKKLS